MILLFALLVQTSFAANAPVQVAAPQVQLNLSQVVKQGLDYSPALQKAKAALEESKNSTSQAKGSLLPTVTFYGKEGTQTTPTTLTGSSVPSSTSSNFKDSYTNYLQLTQPLYAGGAITSGLSSKEIDEEVAKQNFYLKKQDTAKTLVKSFYALAQAEQMLIMANENRDTLKKFSEIINRQNAVGRSRRIDKIQAEVNYSLSLSDVTDAEKNYEGSHISLKRVLGDETDKKIITKFENVVPQVEPLSFDKALKIAEKNDPTVKINKLKLEQISFNRDVDLASDMPSLNLLANAGYTSTDRNLMFDDTAKYYQVYIQATIPIFSGFSSISKRAVYTDKTTQYEKELKSARDTLFENLKTSLNEIEFLLKKLQIAEQTLIDARNALDIANKDYNQGIASVNDVVNLQRTRYDAEKIHLNAKFNYLIAVLNLRNTLNIDLEKVYAQ